MKICGLSSSVLEVVPCRAALAVWLGKLYLYNSGEEVPPGVLSTDEGMLVWIVYSVANGSSLMEVLMWVFPSFGGLLVDLIKGEGGSM